MWNNIEMDRFLRHPPSIGNIEAFFQQIPFTVSKYFWVDLCACVDIWAQINSLFACVLICENEKHKKMKEKKGNQF